MTEIIKKRRQISVKEKLAILNMIDCGQRLSAVARQFGISTSTASTIVKERLKIKLLSEHYNIAPERKRMRLGLFRDVDEAVNIWFRQMRTKNYPVNGPMLQQKAREFALLLGHSNFEGSSGWLFRFRERFGLSMKVMKDDDMSNIMPGIGMTDNEIVASVNHNTLHSESFCDTKDAVDVPNLKVEPVEPNINIKDAISCATILITFLKQQGNVPSPIWNSMTNVADFIINDLNEQLKQKKITDYFKPSSYPIESFHMPAVENNITAIAST